mmetsp:Transcript_37736/g.62473  ORF Transcript_37736/g.62473 Transcript_37736/m.62473 type:complete len:143 (+) Transcript_37736:102-530(+)
MCRSFRRLLQHAVLLPGSSDLQQLQLIFHFFGYPTEHSWPGVSQLPHYASIFSSLPGASPCSDALPRFERIELPAQSLLRELLTLDPGQRVTVRAALGCDYFCTAPLPVKLCIAETAAACGHSVKRHRTEAAKHGNGCNTHA